MALRCSELLGHDFEACQVDAAAGADVALPSVDQSLYILPLGVEELIVQGAAGRPGRPGRTDRPYRRAGRASRARAKAETHAIRN